MLEDLSLEELMIGSDDSEGKINYPQDGSTAGSGLYKDCIAAAISGGNAKNILGRTLTHDELSHMTPDEIN